MRAGNSSSKERLDALVREEAERVAGGAAARDGVPALRAARGGCRMTIPDYLRDDPPPRRPRHWCDLCHGNTIDPRSPCYDGPDDEDRPAEPEEETES